MMLAKQRQISGTPWLPVAAMALAAVAGYGLGSAGRDATGGEDGRGVALRGNRQREIVVKAPPLSAVSLVRESIRGAVDVRQQWRHVRCFSEEEVKAAISELGNADLYSMPAPDFREMLYYRWGELDPVAANAAAKAMFPKRLAWPRKAVLAAWIKQGGAMAAWDAVKDEAEVWDCTRSVRGEFADMLVASLSDRDDAAAFREVLRLDDEDCEVADLLCRARAGKASATPESRAAFLAAAATHPEPYVSVCAYGFLFKEWAKTDLDAARAGASSMPIPKDLVADVCREIDSIAREKERERISWNSKDVSPPRMRIHAKVSWMTMPTGGEARKTGRNSSNGRPLPHTMKPWLCIRG
jgi:hypothetical protein